MAVSLNTNLRHPPIRLEAKPFSGSNFQAQRIGMPNSNAELFSKARISFNSRNLNDVRMSGMRVPLVPMEVPGENVIQFVDVFQACYRQRTVFIAQSLDDQFCNQLMATLMYLDTKEDYKPIEYVISCPGGEINPGLALYDTMRDMLSPSVTVSLGRSSDIGVLLIAGGKKGSRYGFPHSMLFLHSLSGTAYGQVDDVQVEAKELVRVKDYFFDELSSLTGTPKEKIFSDLSRNRLFKVNEAIEYGFIDKIARPRKQGAELPD